MKSQEIKATIAKEFVSHFNKKNYKSYEKSRKIKQELPNLIKQATFDNITKLTLCREFLQYSPQTIENIMSQIEDFLEICVKNELKDKYNLS